MMHKVWWRSRLRGTNRHAHSDDSSLLVLCAGAAFAQLPGPNGVKLGDITVTGSLRSRVYVWNWFETPPAENRYAHSGNLLRLNLAGKRDHLDWSAEFAVPFLLGLPEKAIAPAAQGALGLGSNYYSANGSIRNAAMIFPKQLFLRLNGLGGSEAQKLQIGRFVFVDGAELVPKNTTITTLKRDRVSQRLLGDFGFSDAGRSFDGLHYSYSKSSHDFTLVAAIPTRGVFQVDGWGWNKAAFGYAAYTHDWGQGSHAADTRFFILAYDDWRRVLKTNNRTAELRCEDMANIRIGTFGGHSAHVFMTRAGAFDILAWGTFQTGRWGAQQQRAYAADLEGGFQPNILPRLKPWIRGGFTRGSGDGNPNDNRHGTFFQVLPTPRPYARFPFFNMMNTEDRFGAIILRPQTKVAISSEFHSLRLSDSNDLWYSGGGVFQPWTFGYAGRTTAGHRSLGNLYDTSAEYRATSKLTLSAYLGHTQGLAAMKSIYPQGKDGQFGYLEFLYRF
ncbi:MAG: hypothetical protein HY313_09075 [Acidobacteria bacterium]|nr:hypothetical protein [Acidobacteriota bacterium]